MTKTILIAAVLGLAATGAYACPYDSAKADTQTTASLDGTAMSSRDTTTTGSVGPASKPADSKK